MVHHRDAESAVRSEASNMEDAHQRFAPGFRFSGFDALVLILGTASALGVALLHQWVGLAIGFVVAHFFLFCNILQMSRPLELIWAAVFAGLVGCAFVADAISWPLIFAFASGVTLILSLIQMRHPSYHGVGWKTINPALPEWWRARHEGRN